MRTLSKLAIIFGTIVLGSPLMTREAAGADTTHGVSFGALAGLALPSASGASSRFSWGLQGDYSLMPEFFAGAYFLTSSQDTSIPAVGSSPAVSASSRISLYGVQGSYRVPAYPGLGAGVRLGIARNGTSIVNGGSTTDSSFSFGPYASYDFHIAPQFTVGGDAGILFVTASNSYNIINLLATIKFWL